MFLITSYFIAEVAPFCQSTGCTCPTGYELIEFAVGQTCRAIPAEDNENDRDTEGLPCDVENNCSPYAQCEWVESELRNKCVCNPQYEGNGYVCTEVEVSCIYVSICSVTILIETHLNFHNDLWNRKIFAIQEHHVRMMKDLENLFVNVKLVGKETVVNATNRQSVIVMMNVEIMRSVNSESVDVSKDSKETFQTCKHIPC